MRVLPLLALAGALAACGSPEPSPEPMSTATPDAGPKTLVAAKLEDMALGPRIVGPQGPQVEAVLTADDGTVLGTITSFVACPAGTTEDGEPVPPTEDAQCDPAAMPEGTVYTYVHQLTLGEGKAQPAPSPTASASASAAPTTMVFRMTRPAHGFANVIGFDGAQAAQTLGEEGEIKVQVEDESLIWRVVAGNGWQAGETLTLFWQGTLPPAGPADAYVLRIDAATATARGPFPGAPKGQAEKAAGGAPAN